MKVKVDLNRFSILGQNNKGMIMGIGPNNVVVFSNKLRDDCIQVSTRTTSEFITRIYPGVGIATDERNAYVHPIDPQPSSRSKSK